MTRRDAPTNIDWSTLRATAPTHVVWVGDGVLVCDHVALAYEGELDHRGVASLLLGHSTYCPLGKSQRMRFAAPEDLKPVLMDLLGDSVTRVHVATSEAERRRALTAGSETLN